MKVFERIMQKLHDRQNKPQHVVYRYNYTMEESREYVMKMSKEETTMSFEKLFDVCHDRLHAIFFFLTILELIQQNYLGIIIGEGRNNFIIEYNVSRPDDLPTTIIA